MKKLLTLAGVVLAFGMASVSHAATVVGTELALLVDMSGSISSTEFNLQKQGYANAFNDSAIQNAIIAQGGVAVTFVYWDDHQYQSVNWTLINSVSSAQAFANAILAASRPGSNGSTAPGSAINFITPQFASNAYTGTNKIIDVSGDGVQNAGADTLTARNNALAAGVNQINGLPIGGDSSVISFYQTKIKGGANSFVLPAASFADFDSAVRIKIFSELTGANPTPLPSAAVMGSALMGGLAFLRKRLKKA